MAHRVLLIDDDEAILDVFCSLLASRSYLVDCACNLAQAKVQFASSAYALVIADLSLENGETEGLQVLELARSQPVRPRVLVCSGAGEGELRDKAAAAGADGFIPKPFHFAQLFEKLDLLLASSANIPPSPAARPEATSQDWTQVTGS